MKAYKTHDLKGRSGKPGIATSNGIEAYTSEQCIMTGNKLGSMGASITMFTMGRR